MKVGSGRGQLRALIRLRWQMLHGRASRVRQSVLVVLALSLPATAVAVGQALDRELAGQAVLLLPTVYLGFAVFTVSALLAAGGGVELVPSRELVAFPVSPRTFFASTLLLVPTNLAWMLQVLLLLGLASYVTAGTGLTVTALVMTLTYIVATTILGGALSWLVLRVRGSGWGRVGLWVIALTGASVVLWLRISGRIAAVLDQAPTRYVAISALVGPELRWWLTLVVLMLLGVLGVRAGGRVTAWAGLRSQDVSAGREALHYRRRPAAPSTFRALLRQDHASVWRSRPIRRGVLLLGLLPGAAAGFAGVSWPQAVLLPGLLAAGTALLFGVNAFALDGAGATLLESLPVRPALRLASKGVVVTEVSLAAAAPALIGVSIGAGAPPATAELVALVGAVLATSATITSACLRWSLARPYGVELRGARDVPAPPGAMMGYSARMALTTTFISGMFFVGAAFGSVAFSVLTCAGFLLVAGLSLRRTFGRWESSVVRAQVALAVALG